MKASDRPLNLSNGFPINLQTGYFVDQFRCFKRSRISVRSFHIRGRLGGRRGVFLDAQCSFGSLLNGVDRLDNEEQAECHDQKVNGCLRKGAPAKGGGVFPLAEGDRSTGKVSPPP